MRLRASAEARLSAIGASRPERAQRTYAQDRELKAWTVDIFRLYSRGLINVWVPLAMVAFIACTWTPIVIYYLDPLVVETNLTTVSGDVCVVLSNAESAFRLILTAISFMLVFRLNRSATRSYEARQLCGSIMIHCRDLAMTSIATRAGATGELSAETRDQLCEVAVAFPVAFMVHVWGEPTTRADTFDTMCQQIFDSPTSAMLRAASHRPLALIEHAQAILAAQFLDNGERDSPARATLYQAMLQSVRGLGAPLGGCERIQGTPLPYAYVVHLRSFLLIVVCGIPVVYACDWRWATIPLSLLVAFGLLGIEAASFECEKPFSPTPNKNNHDVEKFCAILSRDVTEMLERAAAREKVTRDGRV